MIASEGSNPQCANSIYLDQFVISNLMKLENPATKGHATVAADPFWRELHDLLFQLRQLQMICCPDSGSHEEESRTSPFNAELKKTYEALSDLAWVSRLIQGSAHFTLCPFYGVANAVVLV